MLNKWLNEITLEGNLVRLESLNESHKEALVEAAADGELWNLWYTSIPSISNVKNYLDFASKEYQEDRSLPFVVVHKQSNKIIGTTRYCNATPPYKRLEIGYTWYSKSYQRTGVNTECKYLLLSHAFEQLESIAVEFRTNSHNFSSRNAIVRLGAKQDGVLRNHMRDADGAFRDTIVFSIIRSEWPTVRKSLKFKMKKS